MLLNLSEDQQFFRDTTDRFLTEREMTRALDEVLQEQVVRALFEHA